jgi:hypothetical protein
MFVDFKSESMITTGNACRHGIGDGFDQRWESSGASTMPLTRGP